jgi:hypothetical protein
MPPESTIWLPRDPLSEEEANDADRYWGLATVWRESVELDRLAEVKEVPVWQESRRDKVARRRSAQALLEK